MTAAQLLAGLRARGVQLVRAGDRLVYTPPSTRFTSEELEVLSRQRAEVLHLLPRADGLWLNRDMVHEMLGRDPEPDALTRLHGEVAAAVRRLEAAIASGAELETAVLVRGRPLSDWLDGGVEALAAYLRAATGG